MENLLNNLNEGILVTNNRGVVIYCNDILAAELNQKKEAIEMQDIRDIMLDEENQRIDISRCIEEYEDKEIELIFNIPEQKKNKYQAKVIVDNFREEKAVFMILKKREIYTKEDLELLLDNVPYELWLKRKDGSYKYTNRKFRDFIRQQNPNFVEGPTIQTTDKEILGQNVYKNVKEQEWYLEETGQSIIIESKDTYDDRWYKTYYKVITNKKCTQKYVVGCRRDCTVSKQLEKELEISTTKNSAINTLLDVSKTELTDTSILDYIEQSISPKLMMQLDIEGMAIGIYDTEKEMINHIHIKKSGLKSQDIESVHIGQKEFSALLNDISIWGIKKADKLREMSLYAKYISQDAEYMGIYPIKYNDKLLGFICFTYFENNFLQAQHHDFFVNLCKQIAQSIQLIESTRRIQEQIKKRLEIEEEYEKSKELDILRNEFFSNISHELRTPLNIMLAMLELIRKYAEEGKITWEEETHLPDRFTVVRKNAYRLLRLINNLIDVTQINAGFCKLIRRNIEVVSAIENIVLSIAPGIEKRGREIIFDTEEEEIIMNCDVEGIEKIVLNLISNAIKYTDLNGKIKVYLKREKDNLIITVEDNGIGIPQEKQELIFEDFTQVDKSFTRRCEGSGIGLSIVKSFVELHNGTIKVESEVNKGTKMIVSLPILIMEESEEADKRIDQRDRIERYSIEFADLYGYNM